MLFCVSLSESETFPYVCLFVCLWARDKFMVKVFLLLDSRCHISLVLIEFTLILVLQILDYLTISETMYWKPLPCVQMANGKHFRYCIMRGMLQITRGHLLRLNSRADDEQFYGNYKSSREITPCADVQMFVYFKFTCLIGKMSKFTPRANLLSEHKTSGSRLSND